MELGPEPARLDQPLPVAQAFPRAPTLDSAASEFSRRFDAELPPSRVNLGTGDSASSAAPPAPAIRSDFQAQDQEEQQRLSRMRLLAMFERNVNVWRSFSIIVTSFTIGWLFYLTLTSSFQSEPPWPAILFNCTLIYGLWRASREMKNGPHMMFIAAAIAMIVCMPINLKLGMLAVTPDMLDALKRSAAPGGPMMTGEQLEAAMLVVFSFAGVVFSVPVWIAALKVAALQRMRAVATAADRNRLG